MCSLIRSLVCICIVLISFFSVKGQTTRTWDGGGGDGLWETAANWVGDVVPATIDFVVFNSTNCASCVITSGGTQTIRRITVQDGASLTLNLSMNIGNSGSDANSIIIQGTGNLVLGDGVTIRSFTINQGSPYTVAAIIASAPATPSLTVTSSTTLTIQNCGHGIRFTSSNGNITNNGIIDITGARSNAIYLDGNGTTNGATFINNGTITASHTSGLRGLYSTNGGGAFTNNGSLTVSNVTTAAIEMTAGTFTNEATLTIDGNTAATALLMSGGIFNNNAGTVDINDATTQAILMNGGDFNNNSTLDLSSCASLYGITMSASAATFDNTSTITIPDATTAGVYLSDGTFTNSGASAAMTISSVVSAASIQVDGGTFDANQNGTITLSNSTGDAIRLNASGNIGGGTFENDGSLQIATDGSVGIRIDDNNALFHNQSNGITNITKATSNGVLMAFSGGGNLTNDGTLNISSTSQQGLHLQGSGVGFTSNNGTITITNSSLFGLYFVNGTFDNSGVISISSLTSDADGLTFSNGTFNNLSTGSISVNAALDKGLTLEVAGFSNSGTIDITARGTGFGGADWGFWLDDTDGSFTFTNDGTINLTGGGASGDQALRIETGCTFLNNGSITGDNSVTSHGLIRVLGTLTNEAGASVELGDARITNESTGSITNNGLITSNYTGSDNGVLVGIYNLGTTVNNAFYSYANGNNNIFSSAGTSRTDNGLDLDVPANMTLNAGDTETVADIGIDVAYNWYNDDVNTTLLATNNAAGLLTFEDIKANAAPSHTDELYTVYGSTVVFTVNNILPVELIKWTGKQANDGVMLEWSTASELNNDRFEVYKSNGLGWTLISEQSGYGTTTEKQNYHFLDRKPENGINYYKLTQVDFDGKSETFNMIAVNYENIGLRQIKVFPNPFDQELNFDVSSLDDHEVTLLDPAGNPQKLIWINDNKLDTSTISSGVYILNIGGADFEKSFLLVKSN